MNRSTAWCVPLASLALSAAAQAADPGFYFAATAGRVEHEVDGRPGILVFVAGLSPSPVFPPGGGFRPPPSGDLPINPIFPPPGGVVSIGPDSIEVDEVDAGFSGTVGYRINRYLAAELSYTDFGEYELVEHYSFADVTYELGVRGPSVSVLGSLPLGEQWELFLRGGVLFADQKTSVRISGSLPDREFSDEVIMAGAGVQWSFAPRWAARLEYQRTDDLQYDNTGESSIDQASLSVLFKL
jgi:opacity protein-like surface antigen